MPWGGGLNTNKYTTSSHGTIGLNLGWSYTQSIANNSTTISWVLTSNGTMSSGYYVQAGPVTVVIGGRTVYSQTARFNMRGDGGFKKTGTITIQHNDDGNKTISMSVKAAIYSASVNCTGSATFTLQKIDRYALLAAVEDFTDEGNPTIDYINPAGTSLVTGLKGRITWNSGANYTSWVTLNDDGGTYTFNLSNADRASMLAACPDSNTLAVKFDLQSTLNGTDYHDYKDATMTVVNANPTGGTITYQDANSSIVAITGNNQIIVQRQSTLRIAITAYTANKSATIGALGSNSYSVNFNDTDYTPDDSGYVSFAQPDIAGTYIATVTATDSRGNTATATVSIPVTSWTEPTADISLERVNGFETNTTLLVNGTISTVTGSSLAITERHKETGGTYSQAASVPNNTDVTLTLNNAKEWVVEVTVSDAFADTVYELTAGKGIPIAFIDTDLNSMSINGFPDDYNQLYVDGSIKADGVVLPHKYSDTEQKIGYWVDGSPIYEQVFDVSGTVPNNTWTNAIIWNDDIQIVNSWALNISAKTCFTCVSAQYDANAQRIKLLNTRGTDIAIDTLIKICFNVEKGGTAWKTNL